VSTYVLGRGLESDLDEIWEYIARDNVEAADRWIAKLFDAFELLGQSPGIGHMRTDLTPYPLLFWSVVRMSSFTARNVTRLKSLL
jgi:plasmid stabilization system protein ParE